jgi:hypothetical protein
MVGRFCSLGFVTPVELVDEPAFHIGFSLSSVGALAMLVAVACTRRVTSLLQFRL